MVPLPRHESSSWGRQQYGWNRQDSSVGCWFPVRKELGDLVEQGEGGESQSSKGDGRGDTDDQPGVKLSIMSIRGVE